MKRGEQVQFEVLTILRQRGEPMSAYAVLDVLRESNPKIAPPTIYRALKALTERGRVHRLESLNAYLACQCAAHRGPFILSICDDCGIVEETVAPDLVSSLSKVVGRSGFAPARHVIEVHGLCSACAPARISV